MFRRQSAPNTATFSSADTDAGPVVVPPPIKRRSSPFISDEAAAQAASQSAGPALLPPLHVVTKTTADGGTVSYL